MQRYYESMLCSPIDYRSRWVSSPKAADIGEPLKEVEYEPIEFPDDVPLEPSPEPLSVPVEPEKEPVPA